jgi:hypothetical protein
MKPLRHVGHGSQSSVASATTRQYIDTVAHRIYLEVGKKNVFAVSLDWPGWCRPGRSRDDAIDNLIGHRERYGAIVSVELPDRALTVVGEVPGNATTDFGAPRARGPWDERSASRGARIRHVARLHECWHYFDEVVQRSPAQLVRGPRGGGRDRDQIVDHVREAERSYAAKIGVRIPPRTPWVHQRDRLSEQLVSANPSHQWPLDYATRIIAWHVVDHAWEIEDKSP